MTVIIVNDTHLQFKLFTIKVSVTMETIQSIFSATHLTGFYLVGMLGLSGLRYVWYLSTWPLLIYFMPPISYYTPSKHQKIRSFSDAIRGYTKRSLKWNGLNCTTQISDSHQDLKKYFHLNPLLPRVAYLYPLKKTENLKVKTHYSPVLLIYTPWKHQKT